MLGEGTGSSMTKKSIVFGAGSREQTATKWYTADGEVLKHLAEDQARLSLSIRTIRP